MSSNENNPLTKIKETWLAIYPNSPAQIRTFVNNFYHHAIFISADNVIQFGDDTFMTSKAAKDIIVNRTSLKEFAKERRFEVRVYSKKERKLLLDTAKIVALAEVSLGKTGYDLIHNNCEHFSNECFFNLKYSRQIDLMRKKISGVISV